MNEPKRYTGVIQELNPPGSINITTTEIFRADDPAIVSALKDLEDVQTILHLVGAYSVDEIKQWKRKAEALDRIPFK